MRTIACVVGCLLLVQRGYAAETFVHGAGTGEVSGDIVKSIQSLGKAGPLRNDAATRQLRRLIFETMGASPNGKNIVPGVRDFTVDAKYFSKNADRQIALTPTFRVPGKEVAALQAKAKVYYDPKFYPGAEGMSLLQRTLRGQTNAAEAFKAKGKIVVSEDYMLYHANGEPVEAKDRVKFKIFSHLGINVEYGKGGHDHFDYEKFVAGRGKLKEKEFLAFVKDNLAFQLKTMQREGVEVPVLCALGGGAFSTSYQPRYSELVAEAYKDVLEKGKFKFKTVVFSLPKFKPEDNLDRYQRVFKDRYTGSVPVVLANTDMVEIAHTLGKRYRTAIVNPADSYSTAGMYWNGGHIALEESLAVRTTMLLTQHLRLNPRVVDQENFFAIGNKGGDRPHALSPRAGIHAR